MKVITNFLDIIHACILTVYYICRYGLKGAREITDKELKEVKAKYKEDTMGDLAEDFRMMKELSQGRRANNRKDSAQFLIEHGVLFTSKNGGAHLIVECPDSIIIDFWPGTGRWITRNGKKGFGVKNLMELITKEGE